MRNEHIKPGDVVPADIRLQVYKQALHIIKANAHLFHYQSTKVYEMKHPHLCLLLPCILWELPHIYTAAPNGEFFWDDYAPEMFPELTQEFIVELTEQPHTFYQANRKRINLLTNAIKSLTA